MPALLPSLHLLVGTDVIVDVSATLAVFARLVDRVVGRHGGAAQTTDKAALQQKHPVAPVLAEVVGSPAPIARFVRLLLAQGLGKLEEFARDYRLIGGWNHAVYFRLRESLGPFVPAVDLDLRDVAAIAQEVTDGADTPYRLTPR